MENLETILRRFAEKEGKEYQGVNSSSGGGSLIANYLSMCETSGSFSPKKTHEISNPDN
jgi:hypothetical protein